MGMLEAIADILSPLGLVDGKWAEREAYKGAIIRLYRQYYNGEHRLKLTTEMKKMMQISDDRLDRYNANYCDLVVHTMADRIQLDTIEVQGAEDSSVTELAAYLSGMLPDVDTAGIVQELVTRFGAMSSAVGEGQAWADDLLAVNSFEALEQAVKIAMLRDGVTYVLSEYDEAQKVSRWHHETAYDGRDGIVAIWDGRTENIVCAVKIWQRGVNGYVNIYFADKTLRYLYGTFGEGADAVTELRARAEVETTVRKKKAPGIPIIPFLNKVGDVKKPQSELRDVIPLQDSLNRSIVSMVINSELTAFSMLLAVGVDISGGMMPGQVIKVLAKDAEGRSLVPEDADTAKALADYYNAIRAERIEGSEQKGFIEQGDWFINQISVVSATPIPSNMGGDSQSGEALKQREVGMLGKVRRVQVHLSIGWKNLLMLTNWQESVFAVNNPPKVRRYVPRFKDAQIRNDGDIQSSADWYIKNGFTRQGLRVMSQSSLASHDERDIDRLLAERALDAQRDGVDAGAGVPGMENFNVGTMVL